MYRRRLVHHHGHSIPNVYGLPAAEICDPILPLNFYQYSSRPYWRYADHLGGERFTTEKSPLIIQNNIHNDLSHRLSETDIIYHDDHHYPYRIGRSRIPKYRISRPTFVETLPFHSSSETIVYSEPTTVVRQTSFPNYERVRLFPSSQSLDLDHLISHRARRPIVNEMWPVNSIYESYYRPSKRIIRVAS